VGTVGRSDALGGLVLAVLIVACAQIGTPAPSRPGDAPPARPSGAAAVALGWPIASDCAEARLWEALPAVGPQRAAALAAAAKAGVLRDPADLLRVPGIGIKMATALAPRVAWRQLGDGTRERR
jgi:hypothetical protein